MGDVRGLRRGHVVLAFGNPLGLAGDGQAAASLGIVSAIGRPLPQSVGQEEDRYYGDMIQTSTPIHPGHSGGPLVDIEGRVIGVLTALGAGGGSGAIGFAVPIGERTRRIIDRLLEGQSIEYGYLGVEVVNLTEAQMRAADLSSGRGVLVDSVVAGEPLSVAGLRGGDIILSVDRRAVSSADDFVSLVGALEPGRTTRVEYLRRGQRAIAEVTVGHRPALAVADSPEGPIEFRGAVLENVPSRIRETNHLPAGALLVVLVSAGSPVDRAGLAPGDVIVRMNGRPISEDLVRLLSDTADDCLIGLSSGHSMLVKAE
jgi:serine protease Do